MNNFLLFLIAFIYSNIKDAFFLKTYPLNNLSVKMIFFYFNLEPYSDSDNENTEKIEKQIRGRKPEKPVRNERTDEDFDIFALKKNANSHV